MITGQNFTTLNRMMAVLNSQLCAFKRHYYKKTQSVYFDSYTDSLEASSNRAVMQIDFAEIQDEIQTAHWSHAHVAIFTCCVWHKKKISFAVISDD